MLYNGTIKSHDFHAAARGRVWTCRPRRGTHLGNPFGRSGPVADRVWAVPVAAGGFGLAVHPVLYNGTIKSHECQPTACSGCGPSTAGGPVRGQCVWAVARTGTACCRACLSFSLCSATPCSSTARSNHTTFMRRHVAGSGGPGPGVACVRVTLWAVGSGCRPCVGSACDGGWF